MHTNNALVISAATYAVCYDLVIECRSFGCS